MSPFFVHFLLFTLPYFTLHTAKSLEILGMQRNKRLVYPPPGENAPTKVQLIIGLGLPMEGEASLIIGYVLKCNYNLPSNSSYLTEQLMRHSRSPEYDEDSFDFNNEGLISRWELYEILEKAMTFLDSGKACLLKAICESAEAPFRDNHGLMGELLHVLLTPSATTEKHLEGHREYYSAEFAGRESKLDSCGKLFPECTTSALEYFTELTERPEN